MNVYVIENCFAIDHGLDMSWWWYG